MSTARCVGLTTTFLMCVSLVYADKIAEPAGPPVEQTLAGTIKRQSIGKNKDGTDRTYLLLVTSRQEIWLTASGTKVNATKKETSIDLANYIGKQVRLVAVVSEVTGKGGEKFVGRVISVTRVEED